MSTGMLLLNASYEPLDVTTLRRAVTLIQRGIVEVLDEDPTKTIRYGNGAMAYPVVMRLKRMVTIPYRLRGKVTNTFLFARDDYTCQYCGKTEDKLRGRANGLTRDHIMPRSRGGLDEWTNVVAACSPCNSKKDNKTPKEAGMKLLRQPHAPRMVHLKWKIRKLTDKQLQYITQFYGDDWFLYVDPK